MQGDRSCFKEHTLIPMIGLDELVAEGLSLSGVRSYEADCEQSKSYNPD